MPVSSKLFSLQFSSKIATNSSEEGLVISFEAVAIFSIAALEDSAFHSALLRSKHFEQGGIKPSGRLSDCSAK